MRRRKAKSAESQREADRDVVPQLAPRPEERDVSRAPTNGKMKTSQR